MNECRLQPYIIITFKYILVIFFFLNIVKCFKKTKHHVIIQLYMLLYNLTFENLNYPCHAKVKK